ncbi:isopenicillin N synthase family dioxygenase [Gordonia sp. DT219]|uniref:isopenicillin N synthase family dioxygenase n=1 Tax=Gordonia sp. DT219 TaxID=3416658 RepID=UPI003CF43964
MVDASLPVIDLSLAETDPDRLHAELLAAGRDVGFFYLTGHGVDDALFDRALATAREFFAQPDAVKDEVSQLRSPQFRGYTRVGGELTNGRTDWREQIDLGPDRDPIAGAEGFWNLQGPNLWPSSPAGFREIFTDWSDTLTGVGMRLLQHWAIALGARPDVFEAAFEQPETLTKLVRYPGDDAQTQGVGAHKDSGVLTLLLAEPGSAGLQVQAGADEWIDATPIPYAFIVNIGELLEVATGGVLRATLHRVLSPPAGTDRISVPFFLNPRLDAQIPVLDVAHSGPGVEADPNNPIFTTYGENAWKARLRAHPDVAARHHGIAPSGPGAAY